jgi:hypothetical protein
MKRKTPPQCIVRASRRITKYAYRICEHFGAVKANTLQDLHHGSNESNVEHRFCEFNVAKVTRTLSHASCAGLTLHSLIYGSHTRIYETSKLGSPILICLWKLNLGHRHCAL